MNSLLWLRLSGYISVVRLQAFETTSETGRAKERHRRLVLSSASSIVAKGVAMAASLISVPLTIRYLGTERYGMWMTITSFAAMLSFSDFGMGNGLLNSIAKASGKDDREAAARSVASAFLCFSELQRLS